MKRKALSNKILVLGIDGMDPVLTRRYLDEGKLPNIKNFIEHGAARKDLVMLGVLPTITPPSWTTLATGAWPETHGITDFFRQSHEDLDTIFYNLDSRNCRSEPLWNVLAGAGKKTLVWHWPGSSWPPTMDDPNLHVVDGTNPSMINQSVAIKDQEKIVYASPKIDSVRFHSRAAHSTGAGCIITDLEIEEPSAFFEAHRGKAKDKGVKHIMLCLEDNADSAMEKMTFDLVNSPLNDPVGWNEAPDGAKEFTIVTSSGLVQRPALILKNKEGIYDRVALYKTKKDTEPYVIVKNDGQFTPIVLEDVQIDEKTVACTRSFKILDLAPDGGEVKLYVSDALEAENDNLWQPKSLYQEIIRNVGWIPAINSGGGTDPVLVEKLKQPTWCRYTKWQADALNYLIENHKYDVVFSHLHNVDMEAHFYWAYCKHRDYLNNDETIWQKFMENLYIDTDRYVGRFLHLLDQGWSIMILSDHGLVVRDEEDTALLADPNGVMIPVMEELGYTSVKRDANGNRIKEIDWEHTKAINTRGNFIWINLKGRNKTGIVDPKDKDELETKIIDDLYAYKEPKTGKRVVSFAMRNKDAALLGLSGPETGDIVFFIEDGFAKVHGDGLSTCQGYAHTSLSPIFMAAGQGFKKGVSIERVIREVDIAPTIAVLAGVRMPANCEGAPIYQIFDEDI